MHNKNIELLYITPLWVADFAISQCWDKGCSRVNIERMHRIANKYKHRSTIEHIYVTWAISDKELVDKFMKDRFAIVTRKVSTYIVTTNMRALGNMNLDIHTLFDLVPEDYRFLVIKDYKLPDAEKMNNPIMLDFLQDDDVKVTLLDHNCSIEGIPDENKVFNFHIEGITRGVLQELARHRVASFSVKSTRYTLKELKTITSFKGIFGYSSNSYKRAQKFVSFTDDKETNLAIIKALENLRELIASGKSNDIIKDAIPEAYRTNLVITFTYEGLYNFLELRLGKSAWYRIRNLAHLMLNILPLNTLTSIRARLKEKGITNI